MKGIEKGRGEEKARKNTSEQAHYRMFTFATRLTLNQTFSASSRCKTDTIPAVRIILSVHIEKHLQTVNSATT